MERQKIFFTSDLHFGHENVLSLTTDRLKQWKKWMMNL